MTALFRAFAPPRDAVTIPPAPRPWPDLSHAADPVTDRAYVRRAERLGVGLVVLSAFLVLLVAYAVGRGLVAAVWGL